MGSVSVPLCTPCHHRCSISGKKGKTIEILTDTLLKHKETTLNMTTILHLFIKQEDEYEREKNQKEVCFTLWAFSPCP